MIYQQYYFIAVIVGNSMTIINILYFVNSLPY